MYTLTSREFQGKSPVIHEEAFVAPQVFLSGDVRIAKYASIWPGVVARGDVNYISVGDTISQTRKKYEDAKRYDQISYDEVLDRNLKVMDLTAITLIKESKIPVIVFKLQNENAILNAVCGKGVFTTIKNIEGK